MLHSAVERKLEVFGEAAGRISEEMQMADREIPWKDIKGVRLILAHKYADMELSVVGKPPSTNSPIFFLRLKN
jgi:uncharacterized protein with HEPN domain